MCVTKTKTGTQDIYIHKHTPGDCEVNMRHSECHLNVLDNFMLPIVSHWDIYEELHFMQDGGHPHFALLVCAWLDNCFPSWIGHQGVTRRPPFCGVWQ